MKIYFGLGANLGDREGNIREAVKMLTAIFGDNYRLSSLYETRPVGFKSDKLFLNAVAIFDTPKEFSVNEVLSSTQLVEYRLGRRGKTIAAGSYKDRPIDIDVLLIDDMVHESADFTLPHPRLTERRFVLEPLCELDDQLRHPVTGMTVLQYLKALNFLTINKVKSPSSRTAASINRLMAELSPAAKPIDRDAMKRLLDVRSSTIYLGYDETDYACAMGVLSITASPTGIKAWIDDIVVDSASRRRGYGKSMMDFLISEARRLGAGSVSLTSRPERIAANSLYRSLGFELRQTNTYRLALSQAEP